MNKEGHTTPGLRMFAIAGQWEDNLVGPQMIVCQEQVFIFAFQAISGINNLVGVSDTLGVFGCSGVGFGIQIKFG